MKNKVDKAISRKVERILSKFDLEGKDEVPVEALFQMAKYFENSMNILYNEYRVSKNISDLAEKDIQNYIKELDEKNMQLSHQSKLAGIGEMSANIGHEINTPLMVILSNLDLIKLLINKNKKSFDQKSLDQVIKTVENSKKTTSQITDIIKALKKISSNPENTTIQDVNIMDLISESIVIFKEKLKKRSIFCEIENKTHNSTIKANEVVILQVVTNLIQNAMDATENLSKEERWIKVLIESEDGNCKMSISNGGPCISEEIVDKIFDPFFSTKPVNKGTGLGLGICKKNIESMNGSFSLDNSSCPKFVVTIPH